MLFRGTFPALPTPFRDGALDLDGLRRVIRHVTDGGVDGLVACGTTGESPTLSADEWCTVVETTVASAGDLPVLAGTGSNNTAGTIALTRRAADLGVAGALVVVPYYNKPTQSGIRRHFELVAAATKLPLILYNIPNRTGVNMDATTTAALSRIPNVVGLKDAGGCLEQAAEIVAQTDGDRFSVLSGDDALTLPILAVGGRGVISTAANVAPAAMASIISAWDAGRHGDALVAHQRLLPLFRHLFVETNPAPVKAALARMGLCTGEVRSPLTPLDGHNLEELERILLGLGAAT